jgi:TPR repeat protein
MTIQDDEQIASKALDSGNFEDAVQLLNLLTERNSHYAMLGLGWIYETGAVGDIDKAAAQLYYERAIAAGSVSAYFELGRLFVSQGEETCDAGGDGGHSRGPPRLGRMMVEGRGGPADIDAGLAWLERAAAQGHIYAQRALITIEERDAQTGFEKLSAKRKILSLVKRGTEEMLKDPHSDKIR